MDLDLINRDPNEHNGYIKVGFEDVLSEPAGVHSIDCVWKISYRCFEASKSCCYKLLTLLCGICIALCWGCTMACVAYEHIWCITPFLRYFRIECTAWRRYYSIIMECCCAPCCETMGLCFSKINVKNQ